MAVADNLSRLPSPLREEEAEEDLAPIVEAFVGEVVQNMPATPHKIDLIKRNQLQDPCLSKVILYTLQGWPENYSQEDTLRLAPYWAERSHLSVIDSSLLTQASSIVIPVNMRKEILSRIHDDGHLSLQKSHLNVQE